MDKQTSKVLRRIEAKAAILGKLIALREQGVPMKEAYDAVFGAGAYKKLAADLYAHFTANRGQA